MLQAYAELRKIHELIDQAGKWLEKQLGTPLCVPNCGLCCQQNVVSCHSIEASYIISGLMGTGLTRYVDASRAWLVDRHNQTTIYDGMPRGVITGKLREEWNLISFTPCIFYKFDTKQCAIHRFRPLSCRAFGVTKMASYYCPRPLGKDEDAHSRAYVGGEPAQLIKAVVDTFIKKTKTRNPDWATHGFLPTMIFRQAREKEFRGLVADNMIASAKLVGTDYSLQALWQEDVEFGKSDPTRNLIRA